MTDPASWQNEALCRPEVFTGDPDVFYPPRARDDTPNATRDAIVAEAKSICARCRVIRECGRDAVERKEPAGIFGGMTPEERGVTEAR